MYRLIQAKRMDALSPGELCRQIISDIMDGIRQSTMAQETD